MTIIEEIYHHQMLNLRVKEGHLSISALSEELGARSRVGRKRLASFEPVFKCLHSRHASLIVVSHQVLLLLCGAVAMDICKHHHHDWQRHGCSLLGSSRHQAR
jgi:hypothetical protein